jgi:hypothetical protein
MLLFPRLSLSPVVGRMWRRRACVSFCLALSFVSVRSVRRPACVHREYHAVRGNHHLTGRITRVRLRIRVHVLGMSVRWCAIDQHAPRVRRPNACQAGRARRRSACPQRLVVWGHLPESRPERGLPTYFPSTWFERSLSLCAAPRRVDGASPRSILNRSRRQRPSKPNAIPNCHSPPATPRCDRAPRRGTTVPMPNRGCRSHR